MHVVNGVRRPKPTQGCRAIDDDDDDANEVMISADDDFCYKKVIILKLQKHL